MGDSDPVPLADMTDLEATLLKVKFADEHRIPAMARGQHKASASGILYDLITFLVGFLRIIVHVMSFLRQ